MRLSAKEIADNASFQAFMNCYLREIDSGVWHSCEHWQQKTGLAFKHNEDCVLELQLNKIDITLAIGVSFRSLVGRHRLTKVYQQQKNTWTWQAVDTLSVILLLINNIYRCDTANKRLLGDQAIIEAPQEIKSYQLELISRTIESHQVMADYVEQRMDDPRLNRHSFIDSEQSLLFGHWLHPTPKSRQGMHSWQHQHYTPELCSRFQLHFFAVDRQWVQQDSARNETAETIILKILQKHERPAETDRLIQSLGSDKLLIPIHPLQAQYLLHQDYIKQLVGDNCLIDLGQLGPYFSPTSSVRTLYCDELDYMLKLSIPVKITNSLRVNMQHELSAGVLVSKLFQQCGFSQDYPQFKMIDDPGFITLQLPDRAESGFEVIIRDNPFAKSNGSSQNIQSIAALVQDPIGESTSSRLGNIINGLAETENKSLAEVSLLWFERYWQCAIEPALYLYDQHGIALEAHQQNSLLDISQGYPSAYYYRDNQGFYLSQNLRTKILALQPELAHINHLFYKDSMICHRFSYYLMINQVFSVVNRFALDGLITEKKLLDIIHQNLSQVLKKMKSVGADLVKALLYQESIPCKGNLLTRIEDVDELQVENELAVYTYVSNPLYQYYQKDKALSNLTEAEVYLESA